MSCTDVQTIQAGDGSKVNFSFDFPYIFKSEIHVYFWNATTKEWDEVLTTDATYPWQVTEANPTIVEFTGTAPPSPTTPVDPNETSVDNVRIRRITNIDDIRALFNPGSAIRSDDLNNNFEQLRYAIQESNCPCISDDVYQYLLDNYWDRFDNTLYSADTWRSNDATIATTAALDKRFQDEVNDTFTKAELATASDVMPDNDDAVPTTGAVKDFVDHVVETDILVDDTGLNKTGSGGQVTLGISANSVDFDRIKNSDKITKAKQDAGSPDPTDSRLFTSLAAARRFDTIVDTALQSTSVNWEVGKTWLQNDSEKTVRIWDGSAWVAIASGGEFTTLSKVVYVDSVNGDDNLEGHRISNPKRTIKAAIEQINAETDEVGDGSVVIVAPGVYQEAAPIDIKKKNVSIIGQALRSCIVHPTVATQENTLFRLNTGSYVANLTLTGIKASGTRGGNSLDTNATYGLPTNQGWNFAFYPDSTIVKSPYIANCTNFSDSEIDNSSLNAFNPEGGFGGDDDSAPTGGGILIDGAAVNSNSPLRSMVCDSYTHVGLDGPGIFVTNNGYCQATSSYAFFTHYHIKALNGGQANLAASTSDFGRYGLIADGKSPTNIFTGTAATPINDTDPLLDRGIAGATKFTIFALTADSSWFGTATRPQSNMLVQIGGDANGTGGTIYSIISATANGFGWDVEISNPDPTNYSKNLGLTSTITAGTTIRFFLRSMIASSGHTMEYVGSGTDYRALPENGGLPVENNEIVELNGGKVWAATTNHQGKFTVGPTFNVDQVTGYVNIASGAIGIEKLIENLDLNSFTLSDSTGSVTIDDHVNMTDHRIVNLRDPTGNKDAANKVYTDTKLSKSGGTMTGSIVMTGSETVDGRDLSVDGAKLDGIESNADVTDSTNVDAAGAVMNSDITTADMSFVIDEDGMTSDSDTKVPTQQSVKSYADTKLSLAGGTMTGNIVMTGSETVDGRDLSVDGAKLDGIESGADVTDSANVEAAGAVMNSDTTTADMSFVIDEDDMTSDSDTKVPTQQSVKSYADTKLPKSGGTMTGNIKMDGQSDIRFADVDSSNYVALQAPSTINTNYTLTLPGSLGNAGEALITDASGNLAWSSSIGTVVDQIIEGNTKVEVIDTGTNGEIQFTSDGKRAMTISDYLVGIGTEAPAVQLEVVADSSTADVNLLRLTNSAVSGGFGTKITSNRALILGADYNNSSADSNSYIAFETDFSEKIRINNSGRLFIGTTAPRTHKLGSTSVSPQFQIEDVGGGASMSITRTGDNPGGSILYFSKTRPVQVDESEVTTDIGILRANDRTGMVSFNGYDGSELWGAARIEGRVDGNPAHDAVNLLASTEYKIVTVGTTDFTLIGAADNNVGTVFTATGSGTGSGTAVLTSGNMPGRLDFLTTPDGDKQPLLRMRITNQGKILVNTGIVIDNTYISNTQTSPIFQIRGVSADDSSLLITRAGGGDAANLFLQSGSSSNAVTTDVKVGQINFNGFDGTNYLNAAQIYSEVDGTPGTGDMPGRLIFATTGGGNATTEARMLIDNSGNVGIGTTDPTERLVVSKGNSGGDANLLLLENNAATGNYGSKLISNRALILGADYENANAGEYSYIAFETNADEKIRITNAGNLGVGTEDPSVRLEVNGDARIGEATGAAFIDVGFGATEDRNAFIDLVGDTTYSGYGLRLIRTDEGANGRSRLVHRGTGDLNINCNEAGEISFDTDGFERLRIDSSGRLLLGTSSSRSNYLFAATAIAPRYQIESTTGETAVGITRNSANSNGSSIYLGKSRGSAVGSNTAVVSEDRLGSLSFNGADGSNLVQAARIDAEVDGTPGTNDMPGRLVFSTTADGASSPTERMRIDSAGNLLVGTIGDGNVGIGTTSPSSSLHIKGTGSASTNVTLENSTTSTQKLVAGLTGANNTGFSIYDDLLSETTFRIDNIGRVGIGTSSPTAKLSLTTSQNWNFPQVFLKRDASNTTNNIKMIAFGLEADNASQTPASSASFIGLNTDAAPTTGDTVVSQNAKLNLTSPGGVIMPNGNVGIGTSIPDFKLDVNGTVGIIEGSAWSWHNGQGNRSAQIYGDSSNNLIFENTASNVERLRIASNGNVGIGGLTSPSEKLHVAGKVRVGANNTSDAELQIGAGAAGNRNAYIDLVGDTTYSDYGLRLIRQNDGANGTSQIVHRGTGALRIVAQEAGSILLSTNNTKRLEVLSTGATKITANSAYNYGLKVLNTGNSTSRYGLAIQCGTNNSSGSNLAVQFEDGDGTVQGSITFSSGTVTYGAFTAHHPCILPEADNDSGYPYGTLLETTSIEYTQKDGQDTERGILYNVRKTQTANSRSVLGAYGGSMNGGPNGETNRHQALILGDGHILCNNSGGDIKVGDGICSSATAGIGQKATASPSMVIGIAQEDVTFADGEEVKLVAVQYGLQQFMPWND